MKCGQPLRILSECGTNGHQTSCMGKARCGGSREGEMGDKICALIGLITDTIQLNFTFFSVQNYNKFLGGSVFLFAINKNFIRP